MDIKLSESLKKEVRQKIQREAARTYIKHTCLQKILEATLGIAIGGYIGLEISPTIHGVLAGAGVGAILSTGLWVFL